MVWSLLVLADTFWSAALVLFNMSILPLTASFTSALSCCVTSATSCLNCCGNVANSAGVTMSARCSAVAAAAAAAAVLCLASELLERSHSWRRSTTLRYHVKCNSVLWHDLSRRECVWKSDETDVQECHSAKSTCNSTEREFAATRRELLRDCKECDMLPRATV